MLYYPGNIGKLFLSSFYYPGTIWQTDFSCLFIILKTFFIGGPGGRRAGGWAAGRAGEGRGIAGRGPGAAEPWGGPGGGAPRRAGGWIVTVAGQFNVTGIS